MKEKTIEVFGTLLKQETILTINDKIMPGTLVFEALAPFPGYYNDSPNEIKPIYLYLALQKQYTLVDLTRATENVEKVFGEKFDAGKGFIQVYDEKYDVLRVRHLQHYDLLEVLQKAYIQEGIKFKKKTKKDFEAPSLIRLVKFFEFNPIGEGIYIDNKEENHAYIEIPKNLSWKEFNEVTMKVKYNWEEIKFDAAIGAFYKGRKLHEFVRIYTNNLSLEYLEGLRKLYIEKIS